jgi:hypothetical protein
MNFSQALELMLAGKRVYRSTAWAGGITWTCYMMPMVIPEGMVNGRTRQFLAEGDLHVGGYFVIFSQGIWQPGWVPSQADLCATDWASMG